ncbi:MAG: hypothetical protein LBT65_08440 [Synergistaceae bacterium]|nr:hypothetical protein [Synergistaceae bacterium]
MKKVFPFPGTRRAPVDLWEHGSHAAEQDRKDSFIYANGYDVRTLDPIGTKENTAQGGWK